METAQGRWVAPPQRGVWIPPATLHSVSSARPFDLCTLYVDRRLARELPVTCCVVTVSPLLNELLLEAARYGLAWPRGGRQERLMRVALDQLAAAPGEPLYLPLPVDRRARRVVDALGASPGDGRSLADWAVVAGASERTLARLFTTQTGMSFVQWRRLCRLLAAIEQMAAGASVTAAALEVGYDNVSAFGRDFKRALGATPGAYF